MKTFIREVKTMLEGVLTVTAYLDTVPETVDLPGVAFYNVGYEPSRIVGAKRYPAKTSFRIAVVTENESHTDAILNELNALDNTSNNDFQDIQVVMNRVEPKQPYTDVRRAFIDLNLTEKI